MLVVMPKASVNRVLSALIGVTFVLASLFGLAHDAATTHVRCAEHGEMMHGGPPPIAASTARHGRLSAGGGGEFRGHEHCALASAMRESRVAPHVPAVLTAPVAVHNVAPPPIVQSTARTSPLYRSAPKTSPPMTTLA
jgi:hypothetical protein